MGRLNEILESGRAPGFSGAAIDPTCADAAVPRALKEIEQTRDARSMVREMGWKPTNHNISEIKKTWKL